MHSFSMRPAKYFYGNPLPNYLDQKTVLIYRPHPVEGHYFSAAVEYRVEKQIGANRLAK